MESGEGIESELLIMFGEVLIDRSWNPVKELKVSNAKCELKIGEAGWNPVKELKGP